MKSARHARTAVSALAAVAAFLIVLVVIVAICGLVFIASLDKATGAVGPDGLSFAVGQGESGSSVARRLTQGRVIRSELMFRLLMKAQGLEQSLKAGEYMIEPGMSASRILDLIASGKQALVRVTVPEGASVQTVAAIAEEAGVAPAESVLAAVSDKALSAKLGLGGYSLSGYLFPETYFFPKNAGAEALVSVMVETFGKSLAKAVPESSALSAAEIRDRVILASIVEREYRVPEEAPLMASAFWNRLRIGMALQSCATVVYVITDRLGKPHPSRLFDRDIALVDPFNTYVNPGLPPGPICNPGLTALVATFRPASSKYLYFRLVDEASGKHYFSETLDEHIKAAALAVKPRSR